MHAKTRQLFDSQFITCELKGDKVIELALWESNEVKLCRQLTFPSRARRARALAYFQEAFHAASEGADPLALAAVLKVEVL